MTGAAIAAQAELWIDTPFHWQASVRGVGCDCKGLVAGVAAECARPEAVSLEALSANYPQTGYDGALLIGLARLFDRVREREAGDVLLVTISGKPIHLAIAAPAHGDPHRAIEALPVGAMRVRPVTILPHRVHSIWRWRQQDAS
jgi:hypothetical protein